MAEKSEWLKRLDRSRKGQDIDRSAEIIPGQKRQSRGPTVSKEDVYIGSRSTSELQRLYGTEQMRSMKKGGPVKKTGVYKLHKGERVVVKSRRKKR